jgi:hypothetical protein
MDELKDDIDDDHYVELELYGSEILNASILERESHRLRHSCLATHTIIDHSREVTHLKGRFITDPAQSPGSLHSRSPPGERDLLQMRHNCLADYTIAAHSKRNLLQIGHNRLADYTIAAHLKSKRDLLQILAQSPYS